MRAWNETERKRASESLPRLLAGRDRLTRDEQDELLDGVLAELEPRPRARRWPWMVAAACATGLVLLLALPARREDGFAARGGAGGGPGFEVRCTSGGQRGPCRAGARLLFEPHARADLRYFAAFAIRPDGTVIWYFPPDEGGRSLDASALPSGVAPVGFDLGPEHPPGAYELRGLFSATPLTRREVRARVEGATSAGELVSRTLRVE